MSFHLSRALARESQLTPDEQAARDSVVPARMRGVPALPAAAARKTPGEQVAVYERLLRQAGWRVEIYSHPMRGRLEAFHSSGAAVMITLDRRRHIKDRNRSNVYVLAPPGSGQWRRTRVPSLEFFALHRRLPPGARSMSVGTKCRCGKERYPTLAAASAGLNEVAPKRGRGRHERRCYRCEADDRVWHLTSKLAGYVRPIPLADAYSPKKVP
ncbi:hypothetical protein [Streptomyces nigrescens]|uniref:hypothetical protein n=1 Tax=Streptomyces nigrescens TaxID=1920 RepID=UPI0036FCCE60